MPTFWEINYKTLWRIQHVYQCTFWNVSNVYKIILVLWLCQTLSMQPLKSSKDKIKKETHTYTHTHPSNNLSFDIKSKFHNFYRNK